MRAGEGLWAIGDVTGKGAFTHVSMYQSAVCVRDILDQDGPPADYRAVPRVTFTDPEVGSVGMTEKQARDAGLNVRVGQTDLASSTRGWIAKGEGLIKLVEDADRGVLVGATAVGPSGGEILSMLTTAVHAEVPTDTLRSMIYAYPTFHRAVGVGAGGPGLSSEHQPAGMQGVVRRAAGLRHRGVVRVELDLRRGRQGSKPVERATASYQYGAQTPSESRRPGSGQDSIRSVKSIPSQSHSQRRCASGSRRKSPASMTGGSCGERVEQPNLLEQPDVLGLARLPRPDVGRHHLGRVADQQDVAELRRPSRAAMSRRMWWVMCLA